MIRIMDQFLKKYTESGFTQAQFARELGVTHAAVGGWIRQKRCPSSYYLDLMADALKVNVVVVDKLDSEGLDEIDVDLLSNYIDLLPNKVLYRGKLVNPRKMFKNLLSKI